ncbi:PREDICTED: uncharacterized protein LOC105954576 [Erythranthe guttata]|uniref:uncharacterized protein LOC105954576 n=1 Tax=Erythranthe guttata TaxID=4155 RepID=UPI00064D7B24|nr:PREDICTED: uncharacterized protein LOC105954576 [Erythranthe guttata]|eukprot:XP_012833696.1 PREDICTED: uncharacterized protein LOC105954576 [Erythranthe guttata]
MEESEENNRVRWNNIEVDKCFLEACIQEVALNGREGGSLKAESWAKIMDTLKNNYNFVVSQRQMKNRYDYLKQKYQAWLALTMKTGNIYNHATNTINMTKNEWTEYIKAHPKAKSLRLAPLPYPDLCRTLFDGTTATGVHSWGPSSQDPNPGTSSFSLTVRNAEQNDIEDILFGDEDETFVPTTDTQSNDSNHHSRGEEPKKKKKKIRPSSSDNNLIEEKSAALKLMIKKNSGPSVTDCIAKLDELGWDKEDIFYVSAVVIFGSCAGHREAWMAFPKDNVGVLKIIGHNKRLRVVKRRFQHSSQTVHACFHEVLSAMMNMAREGAVGALDGTLIPAIVPISQQTMYRGRGKGECWEGVTHDSRVLTDTVADPRNGFPWPPPGKYYLCDAAYTHTRGFMVPYRNVRYWLGDYRRRRPLTKEERFNHAHAQLRNVIERAYGVLKKRFSILQKMAPFSFNVQRNIVIACFAVHNFIRKERISDTLFEEFDQPNMPFDGTNEDEQNLVNDGTTTGPWWGDEDMQYMANVRDEIATRLMPGGTRTN